jgi:AraC family transcriptional activator of tynA and feaB
MEQGGKQVALYPGDITLIDASLPSEFTYSDTSRQLSLILPRHLVEQSQRFNSIRCAQRIDAATPMAGLTKRLVLSAVHQKTLSLCESEATLEAIVSLLRPAISGVDVAPDVRERLFRKAITFIDENICSEELCPDLLAREVGVSVRGLYRMFSKKGLVVAQYIKNRRLDFCAEALRAGGVDQKLSALGYSWGFSDSSYFSTAFKTRFGVSPGDYRKRYQH